MDIYAIKDLRWKMIKYSFDKHKRLRTVSVLWGVQFNAGVTRSLKRSIYCIFKLFSIQSRMFLSCGMRLGKKIDWNFRGFCSKCWSGCCIKFNAARLHWEVRQQRPWSVSNNWKHGLWQHLMRHYLWWPTMIMISVMDGRNGRSWYHWPYLLQYYNWSTRYNSTSELRNATDQCHCQVRACQLTKRGCHLPTNN